MSLPCRSLLEKDSDFQAGSADSSENEYESRRKKLLYELNSTGKYFAFKEQLKNSIIKIVREKYLKTSAFTDPELFQQFLSELYVFLIDELHVSLNNALSIEDSPLVEPHFTDNEQMKYFALEAEMNRNYDLAAYYYQEVRQPSSLNICTLIEQSVHVSILISCCANN